MIMKQKTAADATSAAGGSYHSTGSTRQSLLYCIVLKANHPHDCGYYGSESEL